MDMWPINKKRSLSGSRKDYEHYLTQFNETVENEENPLTVFLRKNAELI
jgi:hypothetical protein